MSIAAENRRPNTVTLSSGEQVPAFGMGTWHIGEQAGVRTEELATLRLGLDLGARLIVTAEMYGDGRSEGVGRRSNSRTPGAGGSDQQGPASVA